MVPIAVRDNVVASNRVYAFEYRVHPRFPNTNLIALYNDNAAVVVTISNFLYPYLVNPTIVAKDGRTICVHTSTSYTGQFDIEGGRILGCKVGIFDGGAQQLRVTGTVFQNAVDFDLTSIPSSFMELTDVLHKPLPGFAPNYIVFGTPTSGKAAPSRRAAGTSGISRKARPT